MTARQPGAGLDWNLACREGGRQMQCCQYIMGDRDRFDDRVLTETGRSSSLSNLFVSAVILTDKQSAGNACPAVTGSDSASTRHERMVLLSGVVWGARRNLLNER